MDSLQLFNQVIPELEELPKKPKVFWYVSAGDEDFRGPAFLTQHNIDKRAEHNGRIFEKPDLFLYNCIGPEVTILKEKLKADNIVLFSDSTTTIRGKNFRQFGFSDSIHLEVSPEYFDIFTHGDLIPEREQAAFYFEIDVIKENHTETQKILYLIHENIDVFRKVILQGHFEVTYLCVIREGLAQGACKKSIIEVVFQDRDFLNYANIGFKPKYFILDLSSSALERFQDAENRYSDLFESERYYHFFQRTNSINNNGPYLYRVKYKE